jgi:drug/metabolite transporter (DMT)-like permease
MVLGAVLLAALFQREFRRYTRESVMAGISVGLFLWLGYEFQTTGLKLTTPSKSAFLTGVSVVLVPVYLTLGWKRHLNRWTATGVAAAFVGLYLLTVPAHDKLSNSGINTGDLLTIACAISFAFQIILLGRAMERFRFEQIAVVQLWTAALLTAISVPLLEQVYVVWSARVIWAILVTGILGTAAAFTIQAWAQQFTPPTHTALIFSLEPVFAWITSYLVLGERLGPRATVGALLILGGVLLSELKGSAARGQQPAAAQPEEA